MIINKHFILKKYFGHDDFRQGQAELIDSILCGRDTFGIMPTGSGKSICYQIPALMFKGLTIVISPLISLMKDQVTAIQHSGIEAAFINSSLSYYEYSLTMQMAADGKYKIIYIAPERLMTENFLKFAVSADIAMVAIDEVHCVSQWGHDFRPSYLKIIDFINQLPCRPVISAFTATATNEVKEDVISILRLINPFIITTGFDRPNLYFEVQKPYSKFNALCDIVESKKNECGVVYCLTRKIAEEVCENLNAYGYNATRYHAGLNDDERRFNQDDFIFDRKQIMVATNAFGMGIDKSNVSFVVHYNMPKNLENYYQEAGRAGRDGSKAECILLYNGQDIRLNQYIIDNTQENPAISAEMRSKIKNRDKERLKFITDYCCANECLRKYILKYFNDNYSERCNNCSNCIKTIIRSVEQLNVTPINDKKTTEIENDLLEELINARKEIADTAGIPPFSVFTDATLQAMCEKMPRSLADFNNIAGVGMYKMTKYGLKFVNIIKRYADKMDLINSYESIFYNSGKEWTDTEDLQLKDEYLSGLTIRDITKIHKRPVQEIKERIDFLDLDWNL